MATEMLWVWLEGRSRTNSPRQRFHSQLFCKIVRYFCRTLYIWLYDFMLLFNFVNYVFLLLCYVFLLV
jgi:hypothetical protein